MRSTLLERMKRRDEANATTGARETAWQIVRSNFDATKPRRFISGVAVGSRAKDAHGNSINASGIEGLLPVLLLWNHDLLAPIGKVTKSDAVGDSLRFEAELLNTDRVAAAAQIWEHICAKRIFGASVGVNAQAEVIDGDFIQSDLEEISVVQFAAGLGAMIRRVWTRDPVVYTDGRSSVKEIWRIDP